MHKYTLHSGKKNGERCFIRSPFAQKYRLGLMHERLEHVKRDPFCAQALPRMSID
jgi:hypothetical protein